MSLDVGQTMTIARLSDENKQLRAELQRVTAELETARIHAVKLGHEKLRQRDRADAAEHAAQQAREERDRLREALEAERLAHQETRGAVAAWKQEYAAATRALAEDAAGRPVYELLELAGWLLEGYGGGPVADCLRLKAQELAALAASPERD